MENESLDVVASVAPDKPVRWLDGLFFSLDGRAVTREQRRYDYVVLQKVRFCDDKERALAVLLNVNPKDKGFQKSLERLAVKACVKRVLSVWNRQGFWEDLEEPTVTLTAKGDLFSRERLPED